VVNITPCPLYPRGKGLCAHGMGGRLGTRCGLDTVAKRKIHYLYQESNPSRPARSLISTLSGIALGYGLDNRGFESRYGLGIFLFSTASRPVLGPTQSPVQWVPGSLSLAGKRPGREANHSPSASAKVKNVWSCTSTSPMRLHGVVLG
jgi:hypothetical protein